MKSLLSYAHVLVYAGPHRTPVPVLLCTPGAWAPLFHRAPYMLFALGCTAVAMTSHVSHEIPTD